MWIYSFTGNPEENAPAAQPSLVETVFSRSVYGDFRTFHTHREYHLVFLTMGAGLLKFESQDLTLRAGQMCLIRPGVLHAFGPREEGMEFWGISFVPGSPEDSVGSFFAGTSVLAADFDGSLDYIRSAFELIHSYAISCEVEAGEERNPDLKGEILRGYDSAIRCQTTAMLHFARSRMAHHSIREFHAGSDEMQQIMEWITEHYAENITLDVLSRKFALSVSHLSRNFYRAFGISPINYLIDYRISVAKVELLNTDKSIREIAEDVGYDNTYYFSSLFARRTGHTPAEQRKILKSPSTHPAVPDFLLEDLPETLRERANAARDASELIRRNTAGTSSPEKKGSAPKE